MSYHGHFENQKQPQQPKKKMHKGLKIFLIVLAVLVVIIAAAAIAGWTYFHNMANKMNIIELPEDTYVYTEETTAPAETLEADETTEAATEATTVETTVPPMTADDIINILVVGQSARAGEASQMADTTILVSLNTYTGTVTLSSVLRDSYVKLPDYKGHTCGRAKFTVCYNLGYQWGDGTAGAMEMTNICMKDNFGVEVDYNIEIDFESFTKVIDYLGGVDIELTQAEADYLNKDDLYVLYDVEAGVQHLDGMAALSYARMRKAEGDSESDIKRSARQRILIETLLNKVRYLSLSELQGVADELLPLITTTMKSTDIAKLLVKIAPIISNLKIESGTIPVEGTYWGEMVDIYSDGMQHSVLKFESAQQKKLIRAITEAEISE